MNTKDTPSRSMLRLRVAAMLCVVFALACDKPSLVIEDHGIASWIAMTNTFAWPADYKTKDYLWSGVLVQVGEFPESDPSTPPDAPRFAFQKMTFLKGDTEVASAIGVPDDNKAFWVNIVSEYDSDLADPLTTEDIFVLTEGNIHEHMTRLYGLVTYWQGASGYTIEARLDPHHRWGNSFELCFEDDFVVEIYELDLTTETATPVVSLGVGEVDRINVVRRETTPQDGDKQDPSWGGG